MRTRPWIAAAPVGAIPARASVQGRRRGTREKSAAILRDSHDRRCPRHAGDNRGGAAGHGRYCAGRRRRGADAGSRHRGAERPPACERAGYRRTRVRAGAHGQCAPAARAVDAERQCQRHPGQSVSGRRQLPRLYCLPAARHASRSLRLPGRRSNQRPVRRYRQLGPDSAGGARQHHARSGVESAVRPEHPRRRAGVANEERRHASGRRARVLGGVVETPRRTVRGRSGLRERLPRVRRRHLVQRGRLARLLAFGRQAALREGRPATRPLRVGRGSDGGQYRPHRQRPHPAIVPRAAGGNRSSRAPTRPATRWRC